MLWLSLVFSTAAVAQTFVTGAIQANTRWTSAAGPYVLNGPVAVQNGARLTIDPGVAIYMAPGSSVDVQAGSIVATGTLQAPISIQSDRARQGQPGVPGDWGSWRYGPGATAESRLEYVAIQHGTGVVVNGSSPVFNYVDIRDHAAPAVTIDLAASPVGAGNRASGNLLNGIAVPAGDVGGSVRWGLKGLPYVVSSGVLSVGPSPTVTSVAPTILERGQTVTVTINGSRLNGYGNASLGTGVALTPFSGGSASQVFYQATVAPDAAYGPVHLTIQTDAGEAALAAAVTISPPRPVIGSIAPTSVEAESGPVTLTLTGQGFASNAEVLVNAATIPSQVDSATQLRATLPSQPAATTLQVQVRQPNPAVANAYLTSSQVGLPITPASRPVLSVQPTPIALPPDGQPHAVTVRLSKVDSAANTVTIAVSDASKATVSPASVVIPAGQTTATFNITPVAAGAVSLTLSAPTLASITVPLYVTADYRAASTVHANPVGVVIPVQPGSATRQVTVFDARVGVAVGGVLTGVSPAAWLPGTTQAVSVTGLGIPSNAQLSFVPSSGLTVSGTAVSADGTRLDAQVTTASDVSLGAKRVVVRNATGIPLLFTDASRSTVQILAGAPDIRYLEPLYATRGSVISLRLTGGNFQQGQLRITPDAGLRIDNTPQISVDGTSMTVRVDVQADAPLGQRTVQVVTPAGISTANATAANTFSIVTSIDPRPAFVASKPVGITVGAAAPPATKSTTQGSPLLGVLVGAGIAEVTPRVGVVGMDTVVTVRGVGLQGNAAITLTPSAGVALVSTPTANPTGTELQFTLRVDAGAALGPRRLVISIGGQRLTMSRPYDSAFLISAPVPELSAVDPQVLLAGQSLIAMTVRGRNLSNVSAVRFEPATGITLMGPYVTNADNTSLSFSASVAAGAASGTRAVVVTTAAGDSSAEPSAGNMVRIANQTGNTYAGISSPMLGVLVGSALAPKSFNGVLQTPMVGVLVGQVRPPRSFAGDPASAKLGIVVGSAAYAMEPRGWLQGASGTVTVTGRGLESVTGVAVNNGTGILLGSPTASGDGTSLTFSIAVAPDAPQLKREIRLTTANGRLSFVNPDAANFGIGSLPIMNSVAPLAFEQGKGVQLSVRGNNLRGVTNVRFSPDDGVRTVSPVVWSQDAQGELLTVSVYVEPNAPLGNRVIRLEVPGGLTTATSSPNNTASVVVSQ